MFLHSFCCRTFLASQFIRGIKDNHIREQLLINPQLSFSEIVEKSLALEASKIDSMHISNVSPHTSDDINYISRRPSNNNKTTSNYASKNSSQSRSKQHLNLKELGIDGLCLRCGKFGHKSNSCRIGYHNIECTSCKKLGHVNKVCIKTLLKQSNKIQHLDEQQDSSIDFDDTEFDQINKIININFSESQLSTRKYFLEVLLQGKAQKFEVDSGAGLTLLPIKEFEKLQLKAPLQPTSVKFRSYTSGTFEPLGFVEVLVTCNSRTMKEKLYVVPNQFSPILGRGWIRKFDIELSHIDKKPDHNSISIHSLQSEDAVKKIEQKYSSIFYPEIGCMPNISCSLQLRDNAKPVFVKARPVPFALREKVEQELDELENTGIITKVNYSDWGSPLVIIPKPDGNVRLCVDYKNTVNPQLKDAYFPIPKIDELLNVFQNADSFVLWIFTKPTCMSQ